MPALVDTLERQVFSVPVPVTDLIAGDNTVKFGANTTSWALPPNSMHISNIGLEIEVP